MSRDWQPPPEFFRLYRLIRRQQKICRRLGGGKLCLREISKLRRKLYRVTEQIESLESQLAEGDPS